MNKNYFDVGVALIFAIFVSSIYCIIFIVLIVLAVATMIRSKIKEAKAEKTK